MASQGKRTALFPANKCGRLIRTHDRVHGTQIARTQDFNCVPDAIGVDLITTIITCTGIHRVDTEREGGRERERKRKGEIRSDRFVGVAFDRKNTMLFKLYSAIGSISLFLFLAASRSISDFTLITKLLAV